MSIKALRNAGHSPSLAGALVHFETSFMVWVLLGALGAYIARDLHLSPFQKGLVVAVPALGGSFWRLIVGTFGDRIGLRRMGLTTLALTAVPLAWGAVGGRSLVELVLIGLLLGIAGASFAVALPLAGRWYPPELQGLALGIAGAGNSGTIVAALGAPRLAEHVGWHGVLGLALIPVGLAWCVFAILAKEPPRSATTSVSSLGLLADADARWLCWFYAVSFGSFVGLSAYLPLFYVDRFGLTPVTGATFAAAAAAAGSFLRPVGGGLADRHGGPRVVTAAMVALACTAAVLGALPPLAITAVTLVGTMAVLGIANGAVFQVVGLLFRDRLGAVTGLVGAVGGLGGFALPFVMGWLVGRTGSFARGFEVLAVVAAATAVAVASRQRVWRPRLVTVGAAA